MRQSIFSKRLLLIAIVFMLTASGAFAAFSSVSTNSQVHTALQAQPAQAVNSTTGGNVLYLGIIDTSPLSSLNYISPIADFYFTSLLYLPFVSTAFPPAPPYEDTPGNIAQGWTHNSNYTVWTLNLKKGLKWDNGTPLNSTDLAFSLKEYVALDDLSFAPNVTNITIINSTAVQITTNASEPNLLYDWATDEDGIIIPYQTYKNLSPANITNISNYNNIVADGPYVMYNYTLGENPVIMYANPYYYQGTPHYKELAVRIFSTTTSEIAAYKAGTLDAIYDAGPYNSIVPLLAKPGYTVATLTPSNQEQIMFNMNLYPFSATNFRKAIADMINRTQINDRVDNSSIKLVGYDGLLSGQGSAIGLNSSSLPSYSYNFTKVKQLLSSVGIVYSNGMWVYKNNGTQVSFNIQTASYGTGNLATASLVSSELNSYGFKTTVTVDTYATYDSLVTFSTTGWQVAVSENFHGVNPNAIGQLLDVVSPEAPLDSSIPLVISSYNGTPGWNGTYFANQVDAANSLPIGSAAANSYLIAASTYIANMVPYIPLYAIYNYVAYNDSIYWGNQTQHTGLFDTQNEVPNTFWYAALYDAAPISSVVSHPSTFPLGYLIAIVVVVIVVIGALAALLVSRRNKAKSK